VATMNTAVFGVFPSASQAESAMASLVLARFAYGDVSVIMLNGDGSTASAHAGRTRPNGARTAVATAPAIGATLGLLSGIGTSPVVGMRPLVTAGPMRDSLVRLGVSEARGELADALVGLGIPEYEAKRYADWVKDGRVLLSVQCDTYDDVARATEVFIRTGGRDVTSANEESWGRPASPARPSSVLRRPAP
jgi:hypothetical protein